MMLHLIYNPFIEILSSLHDNLSSIYSLSRGLTLRLVSTCKTFLFYNSPTFRKLEPGRSKALEDLVRMVYEKLDPDLNDILWHDHDHPLHDSILVMLWGYYQVFCDYVFAQA